MPQYSDDVYTPGYVRASDAVILNGPHGQNNFEPNGRRSPGSLVVPIPLTFQVPAGTTLADATYPIFTAPFPCKVISVDVTPINKPTGDYTTTVDIHKGNGSTAYATILTGDVTLSNASANRTAQAASLDSAQVNLNAGDSLVGVVDATTGTTGGQGSGLQVTVLVHMQGAA
jgi:hypothetical protein